MISVLSEALMSRNALFRDEQGREHREGGPAFIEYRVDGSVESESYYREGQLHREGGSALISYWADGSVWCEYYLHDQKHRDGGPAVIYYGPDGRVLCETYYLRGARVDPTDLQKPVTAPGDPLD